MSRDQTDIVIAGGGAPGLTLALLLGRAEIDVTVIDPAPLTAAAGEKSDTRTSALMQGSVNILRAAGAWNRCAAQGGPMKRLVIGGSGAAGDTVFEAAAIGQDIFAVNMPNNVLRAALLDEARAVPAVRLLMPASLAGFENDDFGVTVRLSDGPQLRARLLVGADGRGSKTREAAGIGAARHDYGQTALTCLIDHTQPHNDTSTEFHREGGPFTLVPLPGNRSSVVWVAFDDEADRLIRLDRNSFTGALQERCGARLGTVALAEGPQSWPLQALKADRLTVPRVALMAEAAHVLHPLGAQGLNLSLRDAAALAELIVDAARLGQDIGGRTVLQNYERRRRSDVEIRARGVDLLNRLVSSRSPLVKSLRRAGLKTVGHISVLKDIAMREGMGAGHEGGRLAAGKNL